MAALSDAERNDATRNLGQRMFIDLGITANMSTADLKAAIGAMDDFIEANQAALNSAFPVPFRTTATISQKALALAVAAMKKGGLI